MDIQLLQKGHPLWERVIDFAEKSAWQAGPILARWMREDAFRGWERVIAAVEGDEIAGYCTIAERDELPEDCGYGPFIGFVFVSEPFRGRRLSEKMIRRALDYAGTLGHPRVYLMSGEKGLYERYGFQKLGDFETIYGTVDQLYWIAT